MKIVENMETGNIHIKKNINGLIKVQMNNQ